MCQVMHTMVAIVSLACLISFSYAFSFKNVSKDISRNAMQLLQKANAATPMKDMHYAVKLLRSLNISGDRDMCSSSCDTILAAFKHASNSLEVYFAHSAASSCGCSKVKFNAKAFALIDEDFERDDLESICGAALASKAANKSELAAGVASKLKSLLKSDGTFRYSPSMPVSSSANTRLAVTVLSEFAAIWPKSSVDEMIDKVMQLLPEGSDDVAVEPTLFGMLTSISGSKTLLSFTSERLELIVENLQNLIYSHDISTVADAVESLKAVSTFETQPIFFSLASNRFSAGEAPVLLLEATTAIGIELRITAAEAVLKKTGKESVVFSGPLSVSAEGKAALDLGAEKLAPYRYTVEFSVSLEGRPSAILYEDTFTLMGSYEISSVQFGIGANKKTLPSQLVSVDTPFSLPSSLKASAHRSEYVSVAFEVSATNGPLGGKFVKPHQVFVRYTQSLSPAVSAVFLCSWEGKLDDALGGRYRHILSTAEESASFNHLAGEYIVSILVSDFASEAVEWSLGSFTLELSTPAVKIAPLYTKSLLDASDRTLVPLPEIKHKMRPPAKRASLVMSALFTLLSLAPFAAFIFVTLSLKMDLQRLRTVKNLLFLGSITVFLLMYAGYWLGLPGLSFYETISYIVFLTPVTVIIGRAALSNLSEKKD